MSGEIMEIRNGRQSVVTRVAQIERKQDTFSAQLTDLSKSTKQILAKLNEPETSIAPPEKASVKPHKKDNTEYVTDVEFKKFWKKLERVMSEAFDDLDATFMRRFQQIDDRLDSLLPSQ